MWVSSLLLGIYTAEQLNTAAAFGRLLLGRKWSQKVGDGNTRTRLCGDVIMRSVWNFHLGLARGERKWVQLAVSDGLHKYVLNRGTLHSLAYQTQFPWQQSIPVSLAQEKNFTSHWREIHFWKFGCFQMRYQIQTTQMMSRYLCFPRWACIISPLCILFAWAWLTELAEIEIEQWCKLKKTQLVTVDIPPNLFQNADSLSKWKQTQCKAVWGKKNTAIAKRLWGRWSIYKREC